MKSRGFDTFFYGFARCDTINPYQSHDKTKAIELMNKAMAKIIPRPHPLLKATIFPYTDTKP